MNSFRKAFGIGILPLDRDTVAAIVASGADIDPYYLISTEALVPRNGKASKTIDQLPFPRKILEERTIFDSGGYSILTGNRALHTLPSPAIAKFYNTLGGNTCIGPDAPLYAMPLAYTWATNLARLKAFYREYKPGTNKLYNPIHGHFTDADGRPTLFFRESWRRVLEQHFGDQTDGYAIRFPEKSIGPQAQAFFTMQPWAAGQHNVHLLALGGITFLPIAVYLGRFVYNNLTSDAKTHTIDATSRMSLKIVLPNERGVPTSVLIGRNRLKPEKLERACKCPICCYFEDQLNTTLLRLAELNTEGVRIDGDSFRSWIRAHNIYTVEKYIQMLKFLVTDRQEFFKFLEDGKVFKRTMQSIRVIDQLLEAGPQAYAKNIGLAAM